MARSSSVLTAKPVLKEVKIRLSAALLARLDALDDRIETTTPGHLFDRSAICEAALNEAHLAAQRELDSLPSGTHGGEQ